MRTLLTALLLFPALTLLDAPRASAKGQKLDGRMAPDMQFRGGGLNGVTTTTRLSAYRGRVVLVKFWLRDCPICRRTLPRYQALHDRYGKRGLVLLSVVHKFTPRDVSGIMRQLGYDFPVASDLDGSQARRYGVGARPVDYLIGIDGRVKASNNVSDEQILAELGKYRLSRIDPVPSALQGARDKVWRGDVGGALSLAETQAKGAAADATLKAAVAKIRTLADEDLRASFDQAHRMAARRKHAQARAIAAAAAKAYGRTSLAPTLKQLQAALGRLLPSR